MEDSLPETSTNEQFGENSDGGAARHLHVNFMWALSAVVALIFLIMVFVIWKSFFVPYTSDSDTVRSGAGDSIVEASKSAGLAQADLGVPKNKDLLKIMAYQDWQLFVDEQYKFQLQYPEGFAVVRQAVGASEDAIEYQRLFIGAGDQVNPPFATNGIGMTVLVFKSDKSFEEIIQTVTDQFLGTEAVLSDYEIDGVAGKQLEFVTPDKQKVIQRYFESGVENAYYEVKVIIDGDNYESVGRKMINTFKIVK